MQPLLTEKERGRLNQLIQQFGGPGGLGPRLQLYLIDQQEKLDNWVDKNALSFKVNLTVYCLFLHL